MVTRGELRGSLPSAHLKRREWCVKGSASIDTMPFQQHDAGKGRPCCRRCRE